MAATDRDEAIKTIRAALKRRSGKTWSVRGGPKGGSDWGWITISSPPKRAADQWGSMTDVEAAELGELLGLGRPSHHQGVSVAASAAYRQEYIDRAEGRTPSKVGTPYWD